MLIADHAVVRDVRVGHEQVVVADARDALVVRRAAIDGAALAEHVAVADLEPRRLAARISCPAAHRRCEANWKMLVVRADAWSGR